MNTRVWIVGLLVIYSMFGFAGAKRDYDAAVPWAQEAQRDLPNRLAPNWTPSDYCQSAACQHDRQALPPPEESALRRSSQQRLKRNELARSIADSATATRPDPSQEPAYQFATVGQDHANTIVHGGHDERVDCRTQTQCATQYQPTTCSQPTQQPVSCDAVPVVTMERGPIRYTCPSGWQRTGSVCRRQETRCLYSGADYVLEKGGTGWCAERGEWYQWHGQTVSPQNGYVKGALRRQSSQSGCRGSRWRRRYEICGPQKETRPASRRCTEGYTLVAGDCIRNRIRWRSNCNDLRDCAFTSKRCHQGEATRTVNGIPTHLTCWTYRHTYQCQSKDTCQAYTHCRVIKAHCAEQRHGVCTRQARELSCPFKQCSSTKLACGTPSFCLDGECYHATPSQSTAFAKTASALSALSRAGQHLTQPPRIFAGQAAHCAEKPIGFANCCQDGGWGTDLGLTQCSQEAQAIGRAKRFGTAIYLGRYCAHSVLGVCTRYQQGYCLYDSVLAKIIQQQGAVKQLGIPLGSAKHPRCLPLTAKQLQRIDFERIDFTSYYGTLKQRMRLPTQEALLTPTPPTRRP